MKAKILLVEGKHSDHPSFSAGLTKKGYEVESISSGSGALERLIHIDPDLVVVDAASLRTSGKRICQSLHKEINGIPLVLIVDPARPIDDNNGADVMLTLPFTVQKLVNRIKPLLPSDEGNILHVGPIRLDLEQRRVRCLGKQARLTPRLITILRILMDHKGEAVDREILFCQAWDTTYTKDTRTLDVHISWLRRAIEVDPRRPRFLKTIRGIGYRLDV